MHSDRSKARPYTKTKGVLDGLAIEFSCHPEVKIAEMSTEVEQKAASMDEVLKSYKKMVFRAKSELKKEHQSINSWFGFMFAASSEFCMRAQLGASSFLRQTF